MGELRFRTKIAVGYADEVAIERHVRPSCHSRLPDLGGLTIINILGEQADY